MQAISVRVVVAAFAFTFAAPAWPQAAAKGAAKAWPTKPVRLIVNANAGGSTDVTARSVASMLSEVLGQQVVVDNRPGAGGTIGLDTAARATPDGYTLLHAADSAILISPHLYKTKVDVERDMQPISPTAKAALFLIARPGLPAENLAELVAYARAHPGKLNYGSAGHGTFQHIATEMLMREAKFNAVHVAYKGSQRVLVDLLAGAVDFAFDLGASIPHIKSGKVRALAVPTPTRSPIFPELPTMTEAGTNLSLDWMSGVYAPVGTPREIVMRLNREIGHIMQAPQTRALLSSMAAQPIPPTSPEAFAERNRRERARFGAIIRASNIKLN